MKYTLKITLMAGLLLSTVFFSASGLVHAAPLVSPNYRLDAQVMNSFGGVGSSTNYKMTTSGGEAVVGNGSGGSYKLGAGYISQLEQSLELRLSPSGLVGYYPLDTNTGIQAYDSSINNNGSVLVNSPTWSTGKIGNALTFDGANDYAVMPSNSAISQFGTGEFTVSVWYKSSSATDQFLIDNKTAGTNLAGYDVFLSPSGAANFRVADGTTQHVAISPIGLSDGLWHHLVGTRSSAGLKIYIDGTQAGTNTNGGAFNVTNSTNMYFGSYNSTPSLPFNGSMDEVRFYNRALSATEISNMYDANNAGVSSSLTIPQITSGASQNAVLDMQVTTDAGGYNAAISQNYNLRHTDGTTLVPNLTNSGTIALPVLWDEGNTKGLGFALTGGVSVPGAWGTGPVSYKYAAVTTTPTTFFTRTGLSGGIKEVTNMQFKLDVPTTQKSGQYSNVVTVTATAKP